MSPKLNDTLKKKQREQKQKLWREIRERMKRSAARAKKEARLGLGHPGTAASPAELGGDFSSFDGGNENAQS